MKTNEIRLLLTLYSTAIGGAEESISHLVSYLATKQNFKISVLYIVNYACPKPKLPRNVKLYFLTINPKLYNLIAPLIILFIVLKDRINLVNHNFRYIFSESLIPKLLNIPNIATIRAIFIDRNNANELKYVNHVVGISNAVSEKIRELGYKGSIHTIYNGINLEDFNNFGDSKRNKFKLLSIGRLVKWKRTNWSVKAVKSLHDKGYAISLDIFGEGNEKANLQRLIEELNATKYIHIHGFIDKNDERLKEYGIMLIPSFAEPFGKSVVENVIRGKVIVGTNYGAIPELLPDHDLLFDRDSIEDYIAKTELALTKYDYYGKKVRPSRENFLSRFNIQRVIEDYYNLFMEIKSYDVPGRETETIGFNH